MHGVHAMNRRAMPVLLSGAGLAALIVLWLSSQGGVDPQLGNGASGRGDSHQARADLDRPVGLPEGPVEIVSRTRAVPGVPVEVAQDRLVARVHNAGPLSAEERRDVHVKLDQLIGMAESELANRPVHSLDSAAMVKEASTVLSLGSLRSAKQALEAGSYLVTLAGEESPPLTMPESEVILLTHGFRGKPANLTIMMPWAHYKEAADARSYYDSVVRWDDSEKARRFNSLPDEQRVALAAELDAIRKKAQRTPEDQQRLVEWLGWDGELILGSASVVLRPQ